MTTPLVCPICGMADRIQKVSAILSEGISKTQLPGSAPIKWQGETYWLPSQRQGSSITMLAQRLLPPTFNSVPKGVVNPGRLVGTGIGVGLGFLAIGVPLTGSLFSRIAAPSNLAWYSYVILVLFGPFSVLVGIYILLALVAYFRNRNGIKERDDLVREDANNRDRLARTKYDQLYYCHRDDVVFIPGGSQSVSPEDMHALIYG